MFIVLAPKNGLETDEKGKFLVPIARGVSDVDSFYIPIYDTYKEAAENAANAVILELPPTSDIDKLELEVVEKETSFEEMYPQLEKNKRASKKKKEVQTVVEEVAILSLSSSELPVSKASITEHSVPAPEGTLPEYSIESWEHYGHLLNDGELVVVTEKLCGSNVRFTVSEMQQYCGSLHQWEAEDKNNLWWRCFKETDWINTFCQLHPEYILYGEIFGAVQELNYGATEGEIFFRAFDIWDKNTDAWVSWDTISFLMGDLSFGSELSQSWAPVLFYGEYDPIEVVKLVNEQSNIVGAEHMQEGIVIQTVTERYDVNTGLRIKLTLVSDQYTVDK